MNNLSNKIAALFKTRIEAVNQLYIGDFDIKKEKIVHTIIEVSSVCNYNCVMCSLHDYNKPISPETGERNGLMDFELFKKIIDDVSDHTHTICLQGGGEPMLHPRFFDMIEYVRSKSGDISIWFNTNGSKIDNEAACKLIELKVNKVYFSLDAASKKTYESIRRGGSWKTVKNNLINLSKKAKGEIHIGVSFVVQPANAHEKYIFLRKFLPYVGEVVFYTLAEKNRKRDKNYPVNFSQRPVCPLLKEQKYITLEGNVTPCCGALIDCHLGNLKEESFFDILNSEKFRQLIEDHKNGSFRECRHCRDCTQWWGCYNVQIKPSLMRKIFETHFSRVPYSYAMSITSEVYSKLPISISWKNVLSAIRRACSLDN